MLTQKNCLKKRKDFNNISKKGNIIAGKLIFLKFLKNKLDFNRFGLVISLKISKKAVVRNKIKRQLRSIIKQEFSNLKTGLDIVIITKPEIVDKKYQEIEEEVKNLFKKAKIL